MNGVSLQLCVISVRGDRGGRASGPQLPNTDFTNFEKESRYRGFECPRLFRKLGNGNLAPVDRAGYDMQHVPFHHSTASFTPQVLALHPLSIVHLEDGSLSQTSH